MLGETFGVPPTGSMPNATTAFADREEAMTLLSSR
jgi:hypothetical protein